MCVTLRSMTARFASVVVPMLVAFALPAMAQPISAVLKLKDRVPMSQLAANVLSPISSHYGQFYTPEEIRDVSGPSDQDYDKLVEQLKQEGFSIKAASPTHLWISVAAEPAVYGKVFGTSFHFLANGRHTHTLQARVPQRFSIVESVAGLDSTRVARPHFRKLAQAIDTGGITQDVIKSAYGFLPIYSAGLTGKGQHIAVATYGGFEVSDVQKFYTDMNLQPGPTVDAVEFNGKAAYDENSAMETQLDAEFSGMIAPGAAVHVFTSAENSDAGELAVFTAILDDNRAKVANYSWGSCETQLSPSHQAEMAKVFARAVAQGVNITVASGDSGSDSCQDGTTVADWPAANDNVVAVGGTTFAQSSGKIAETAWSGSGGGISSIFASPSWQSSLGAPYVKRSYPDVSFNADPTSGQAIWAHNGGTAQWIVIGGTSMAAPQWAGFLALVGEARTTAGKAPLGYLNPVIYGLSASEMSLMFHDVTSGSNGAYNAGKGWDAVTGLGSMQADALLTRLANQ